jgi:hypothetical protein
MSDSNHHVGAAIVSRVIKYLGGVAQFVSINLAKMREVSCCVICKISNVEVTLFEDDSLLFNTNRKVVLLSSSLLHPHTHSLKSTRKTLNHDTAVLPYGVDHPSCDRHHWHHYRIFL